MLVLLSTIQNDFVVENITSYYKLSLRTTKYYVVPRRSKKYCHVLLRIEGATHCKVLFGSAPQRTTPYHRVLWSTNLFFFSNLVCESVSESFTTAPSVTTWRNMRSETNCGENWSLQKLVCKTSQILKGTMNVHSTSANDVENLFNIPICGWPRLRYFAVRHGPSKFDPTVPIEQCMRAMCTCKQQNDCKTELSDVVCRKHLWRGVSWVVSPTPYYKVQK